MQLDGKWGGKRIAARGHNACLQKPRMTSSLRKRCGEALNYWQAHAEKIADIVYVYAHNGSKFDAIPVIYSIMCATNEPVKDMCVSNGRFISFAWKDLRFRDSMLIATSSLSAACKAYGVKATKGYLPHAYLQGCSSLRQTLDRLHGKTL